MLSKRERMGMAMKMNVVNVNVFVIVLVMLTCAPCRILAQDQPLMVDMTLVRNAPALGAFCLDGSWPAYHLHRGFGDGAGNWLLVFEGGEWCKNIESCLIRAKNAHGSTSIMSKTVPFNGILSNNASLNPDFYNWNRVKLRYCDGASFSGDAIFDNGTSRLYFKGQKIWESIILDLIPQGLGQARKALLSGCSAGGLASFLHCNSFTKYLPTNVTVKCMSDAGFFLDKRPTSLNHTNRSFFTDLVSLQGVEKNLDKNCTSSHQLPELCFFPQYALEYITTPFFILNSAFDYYQVRHILVPSLSDQVGHWNRCKDNLPECNPEQINTLNGFRRDMIDAMSLFYNNSKGGIFLNSCFTHCQAESKETWFGAHSPRINNKTIAEAVGDWYFDRRVTKEIGCAYPCDTTCQNIDLTKKN